MHLCYTASGSQYCPPGQALYLRATLGSPGTLTYYAERGALRIANGSFHFWTYPGTGGGTVNWRIEATTNIDEVSNGCT